MSEIVFQNMEGMLPEVEDLESKGIFSSEEIRIMIKRRTDFEYKLQKRVCEKEDIMKYLEYELNLDLLRKKRTKRLKQKKFTTAAVSAHRRIHQIFQKAHQKFGDDLSIWLQHIDFCKKTNSVHQLDKIFGRLIQTHANNPDVWILAAKHEFEHNKTIDNARQLLQKGLRNNKMSKKLWLEHFKLELLHVDKIKKRRKLLGVDGIELSQEKEREEDDPKEMDAFLQNITASIVYKNAFVGISDDIDFRISFLDTCATFEDTSQVQDNIYKNISEDFPGDEKMWKVQALRPIKQLITEGQTKMLKDEDWLQAEEECSEVFEKAVTALCSCEMWNSYLKTFTELLEKSNTPSQTSRRLAKVMKIYLDAEQHCLASEDMYISWIDLLTSIESTEEVQKVLERGLTIHTTSLNLWRKHIGVVLDTHGEWATVHAELIKCLSLMTTNTEKCEVWELVMEMALACDAEETDQIFKELQSCHRDIRNEVIPQFLFSMVSRKGVKFAHKLFKSVSLESLPLQFINAFIDIEREQDPTSRKWMRTYFGKATLDHGQSDIDVWLDWLTYESSEPQDSIDEVGRIFMKAKKTLHTDLVEEFVKRHTLMKNT